MNDCRVGLLTHQSTAGAYRVGFQPTKQAVGLYVNVFQAA